MNRLVLLRHGESLWNAEKRFTGQTDIPLSEKGRLEAAEAGKDFIAHGFVFDAAFSSVLSRAMETLEIVLETMGTGRQIPVTGSAALNERHYGALQGENKETILARYGRETMRLWRRSYDVAPPDGESLRDVAHRVVPFFKTRINPLVVCGKNILVVAHHNSLRALVMHLDSLSEDAVPDLEIPTGESLVYEFETRFERIGRYALSRRRGDGGSVSER